MSDMNSNSTMTPETVTTATAPAADQTKTLMITDKAVREIKRIQATDETAVGHHLRVMVVGGGCSGMSYKLGFDSQPLVASDKVFEKDGVKVICDAKSFLYLAGTELDFTDGLNGTGFVFKNPNAKRTCGCGSSFSA